MGLLYDSLCNQAGLFFDFQPILTSISLTFETTHILLLVVTRTNGLLIFVILKFVWNVWIFIPFYLYGKLCHLDFPNNNLSTVNFALYYNR